MLSALVVMVGVASAGDLYGKSEGGWDHGSLYAKSATGSPAAAVTEGSAIGKDLSVGEPVTVGGLTIFPVLDRSAPKNPSGGTVGLAEAMGTGQLRVGESGSSGGFSLVNVANMGKTPVYIMAGEVIRGGRQDRMITEDLVIPPESGPMRITVHCVEKDRWSAEAEAFRYGGRAEVALRAAAEAGGGQEQTWAMVAALNAERGGSATGAYVSVGGAEWLRYRQQLHAELAGQQQVVGAVIAQNGQLVHAEMFGDSSLSTVGRAAALDGYARDAVAMEDEVVDAALPDVEEAAAFLRATLRR